MGLGNLGAGQSNFFNGQELLSFAASWAVCLMLVLYWGSYLWLRRKY